MKVIQLGISQKANLDPLNRGRSLCLLALPTDTLPLLLDTRATTGRVRVLD